MAKECYCIAQGREGREGLSERACGFMLWKKGSYLEEWAWYRRFMLKKKRSRQSSEDCGRMDTRIDLSSRLRWGYTLDLEKSSNQSSSKAFLNPIHSVLGMVAKFHGGHLWSSWMVYLLTISLLVSDGESATPPDRVLWLRYLKTLFINCSILFYFLLAERLQINQCMPHTSSEISYIPRLRSRLPILRQIISVSRLPRRWQNSITVTLYFGERDSNLKGDCERGLGVWEIGKELMWNCEFRNIWDRKRM